jgi:hypothetical protein
MAEQRCPYCQVAIPEAQAESTHCPNCRQELLLLNVAPTPAPAPAVHVAPPPGPAAPAWSRWGPARVGLTLWIWGTVLLGVLGWAAAITFYFAPKWVRSLPESPSWAAILAATLGAYGFGALLVVLGVVLCLLAPREAAARGWRLLLPLGAAGLIGEAVAMRYQAVPEEFFKPALGGLALCGMLIFVSAAMMLRAYARARGDNQLGRNFVVWLIASLTQQVVRTTIFVGTRDQLGTVSEAEFFQTVGGCWMWCDVVLSLALFVWWVRLLWQLRDLMPWPPRPS